MARRSLARREPGLVFRLELNNDKTFVIRVWQADQFGRMLKDKFFGQAVLRGYEYEKPDFTWLHSHETDALNSLPDEIADWVCKMDDMVRDILRDEPDYQKTLAEYLKEIEAR